MIYSCKNCTERHVGCHATCPKYIHDKEKWDKPKAQIAKDREGWCAAEEQHQRSVWKALKRRK